MEEIFDDFAGLVIGFGDDNEGVVAAVPDNPESGALVSEAIAGGGAALVPPGRAICVRVVGSTANGWHREAADELHRRP